MFSLSEIRALDESDFPFREAWEADEPLYRDTPRLGRSAQLHTTPDCPAARKAKLFVPWDLTRSQPGATCAACAVDDSEEQVAMRRTPGLIDVVRDVHVWVRAVDELQGAHHERARQVLLADALDVLRSPFLARGATSWMPIEVDRDAWNECGLERGTYVRDWITRKYDEAWAMVSAVQSEILRERDKDEKKVWVLMSMSHPLEPVATWTRSFTPSPRFRIASPPLVVMDQIPPHRDTFLLGPYDGEIKKDVWQTFVELLDAHASGLFGLDRDEAMYDHVCSLFDAAQRAGDFPRFNLARERRREEEHQRALERAAAKAAKEAAEAEATEAAAAEAAAAQTPSTDAQDQPDVAGEPSDDVVQPPVPPTTEPDGEALARA